MFFRDFAHSVSAYGKAFELAGKLKLWKYFLIPAIIGLIVGFLILLAAGFLADNLGSKISSYWPFDFWEEGILAASIFLGWVIIVLFGAMIFKHVVAAFSAPFMTPVSEKVEMHLTGKSLDETDTGQEYFAALMRGIRINVRNLLLEILITFPLIILSIIPVINLVTFVLLLYFQSYFAGFSNMDYTMERHLKYSETPPFVRRNKGIAVGNGLVFNLLLTIPVIGLMLALPLGTIAATTETVARLNQNRK